MKKYQHYIDARGVLLPTPHRNNDSYCDLKTDPSEKGEPKITENSRLSLIESVHEKSDYM